MAKHIVVLEGVLERLEDGMFVVGRDVVDAELADLKDQQVIITITSYD